MMSASGATRPRGAPCHGWATPTCQKSCLMWQREAGASDPPRMPAAAWGAGAVKRAMNRSRNPSQEATEDSGRLSSQEHG